MVYQANLSSRHFATPLIYTKCFICVSCVLHPGSVIVCSHSRSGLFTSPLFINISTQHVGSPHRTNVYYLAKSEDASTTVVMYERRHNGYLQGLFFPRSHPVVEQYYAPSMGPKCDNHGYHPGPRLPRYDTHIRLVNLEIYRVPQDV
jgi:hypothetical protein